MKNIIDKIFPYSVPTVAEIEDRFPRRKLKEGEKITRIAPSPTGFMHIGSIYTALLCERVAHLSDGKFILRIEDTDQKREVEGAVEVIKSSLENCGMKLDEYEDVNGNDVGAYGPYRQSRRKEIYQAYIKQLVEDGFAYPCFCTTEDLDQMREMQEKYGSRPGYYAKYATCRRLTEEETEAKIDAGVPFVIRLKSFGKFENKIKVKDEIKGVRELPENDLDIVIMKSDGLPTYHFAHAVDDYLMGTTHVIRGDEWFSSVPLHIQLFQTIQRKGPKYAHISPINKMDGDSKRKLSKRKDPEANYMYFVEQGYPKQSVIEYLINLANSNFEDWKKANPTKSYLDFEFSLKKMNASAGALFDFVKLDDISKNIIATYDAKSVYDMVLTWAKEFDKDLAARFENDKEYALNMLSIERENVKKPRKDIAKWFDIVDTVDFFYDDKFNQTKENVFAKLDKFSPELIQKVIADYVEIYNHDEPRENWFPSVKEVAAKNGFATDMKAYKQSPDDFPGNVADVATMLRVVITGKLQSPDLYAIMQVMGVERVLSRFNLILK
jgi:glutamyl-tRNA synthetase